MLFIQPSGYTFNNSRNINNKPIIEETYHQSDIYLNNLTQDRNPIFNFWLLVQLENMNSRIKTHIQNLCKNYLLTQSFNSNIDLYLKSLIITNNNQYNSYWRLNYTFKKNKNIDLLIAYLYELKQSKRKIYLRNLDKNILSLANNTQKLYLNILDGNETNVKSLLKPHPFKFSDIFLFKLLNNKDHKKEKIKLLKFWSNNIYNTNIVYILKETSIFNGYYSIYDYANAYNTIKNLNYERIPNYKYKITLFKRITYTDFALGLYYKNIQLYKSILIPLSNLYNLKSDLLFSYLSYGNTLFRLGKLKQAQSEYELVYKYPKARSLFNNFTSVVNNLAITYLRTGNFSKYIKLQLAALNYAISKKKLSKQLHILNNLSIYYKDLGDLNSAILYANRAKNIALKHNMKNELAYVYPSIGYIYSDLSNDFYKAKKMFVKAIKIANKIDNYNIWARSNSQLASLYEKNGLYKKAIIIRNKIIKRSNSKNDNKRIIFNNIKISNDYFKLKKFKLSYNYLQNTNNNYLEFNSIIEKNNIKAKFNILNHKTNKAKLTLYRNIKRIIKRAHNSAEVQSGHLILQPEELEAFKLLTNLYIKTHQYDKALITLDKIKTINKVRYTNSDLLKSNLLSEKELIQDKKLSNYIETLQSKLQSAKKDQKIDLQNKLAEATTEKKQLESKLLKYNSNSSVNIQDVKRNLRPKEAILYFTQFQNRFYLATITRHHTKFDTLTFKKAQIDTIKTVIKRLHKGHTNLIELHRLFEKLLSKINLSHYRKLDIIPDGFLYELPLGILPVNSPQTSYSYGSAHYLIENHPISYYTSLKNFEHTFHEKNHHYKTDFLGIGISKFNGLSSTLSGGKTLAPLPFTQVEVSKIDSLLPYPASKKKLFLGKEGTEKAFRKWVSSAKIIHLATHSEVYYENPLFSVIYLDQDSTQKKKTFKDDGKVHAYELFEMNLDSKMVMLSSCESGAGDYITGSGMIGLSRALTYAGAQSLVLNLWSINDQSAANISIKFYQYLKKGYTKAQALRKAKLYYMNNNDSNPYQWGSFVVTGNDSPLFSRHPYEKYFIFIGGMFLIGILGLSYYNHQKKV